MSLFRTDFRFFLGKTTLACWCIVAAACLPTLCVAEPPNTSSNRFLFIIDTSSTMKKWDEPLRDSVFDLLFSGVRGHMTNGDSYGVWLAAEVNDTSSSVEVWRKKFATELASRTALRVKDAGCKGKSALDIAIGDASRVAAAIGDVTVILVSNGDTPLHGTPFDAEINSATEQIKPAMKQAKATINTTLVARNGKFIAWAINSPEFLVGMPSVPPPQVPAAPVANVVAKTAEVSSPPPSQTAPPPPVRVASKPIVITRETVDREKEATRALASTLDLPGASTPTAKPAAPAPTRVVEAVAPTPPVPVPAPAVSESAPSISPSNAPVVAPPPPAETAVPTTAIRDQAQMPTDSAATAAPVSRGNIRNFVWIVGGALLLMVAAVVILIRRSRPAGPSLVSEAIALDRLYKPRS